MTVIPEPITTPRATEWTATHRHRKGNLYRVLMHGVLETNRQPVIIYDDADGTIWVRPTAEFEDGRFILIDR